MWHVLAMGALACSGCAAVKKDASFEATVMASVDRVEVSAASGNVRIRGTDKSELHVEGKVTARAGSPERVEALLALVKQKPPIVQSGNVWKVGDLDAYGLSRSESLVIDFDIQSPKGADVEVDVASGDIRVEGVSGKLELDSASGDVAIVRASGEVNVDTASGDTTLEVTSSRVEVDTASGDIQLKGAPPRGARWKLDTASGDIRVQVPSSSNLDISADTASGEVLSTHPGYSAQRSRGGAASVMRVTNNAGAGSKPPVEGTVELSTASGDIQLGSLSAAP